MHHMNPHRRAVLFQIKSSDVKAQEQIACPVDRKDPKFKHLTAGVNIAQQQQNRPLAANPLTESAVRILRQGLDLLTLVSAEDYTRKMPLAFNATMGGHYRHCLEHFQLLLEGANSGTINYEARDRNKEIENNISFARQITMDLIDQLYNLRVELLNVPLSILSQTQYETVAHQKAESTFNRELMYGVAHAIHHYALIGIMAAYLKIEIPENLGIAPSTMHQRAALETEPLVSTSGGL